MCTNDFNDSKFRELDEYIESLEVKEGSLIAILHKAQDIFGYLPRIVQSHVAQKTNIPEAKIYGVVTFYSYFNEAPRGEHVVNVCLGTACFVKGSMGILHEVEEQLGISAGQTTPDGKYSIDTLRCIGACGLSPVVMIDGKVHGRVERKKVRKLLQIS
ncbi:NAD(P)H-dependent oxidoreductase subunit E [Desulfitobacterium sp.]|uniref:NADH-quinone oxidoreductase subunit NuoE family protein n=1 Tax=Desulfitobacterium sp. TaxID=49981 RepID=UPI002B218FBB|nr:NAD(P)H-dependent oxidoreductase subunit E [Desulfitobacterium sp.]MEA4901325.1 NAD(P)H-dependent oxidoreductase subunit E [Desulfitobacterium sp.]